MAVSPFRDALIADIRLEQAVRRELLVDPRAGDAQEVAISADEGFVTLSGAVDTFQHKRAIGKVAARVVGVTGVVNGLRARRGTAPGRAHDCTLRAAVLQALMWNSMVPDDRIKVSVSGRCVHLTGNVDQEYEADAAYDTVADLVGVVDATADVHLTSAAAEARRLIDRISAVLIAARGPVSSGIVIRAWAGGVTLTGTMPSLQQHDEALATMCSVPGVVSVEDKLSIVAIPWDSGLSAA